MKVESTAKKIVEYIELEAVEFSISIDSTKVPKNISLSSAHKFIMAEYIHIMLLWSKIKQ